ncbi:unnamed protein product [Penicillium olsonii]|nr:unnamed protein product [Penicillium olsonii]CAG7923524.1 unnamed protein product [Penicillium olsonii]
MDPPSRRRLGTDKQPITENARAVLDRLELHRAGQMPAQSWWQYRLVQDDYETVLHALDGDECLRGYVEDKVRLDYDPYRSYMTIRLPTSLHDIFRVKVVSEILTQLSNFQSSDKAFADFARKVDHRSTTRIRLPDDTRAGEQPRSERNPDASFKHDDAKYPGVIIEVCCSGKARAAADLAEDYILDTNGSVTTVIALNIEHECSKQATISIWRPGYVTVDGIEEIRAVAAVDALAFRTASGHPIEEPGQEPMFRLSLGDFAPPLISREPTDIDQYISMSSRQLCDFLSHAETSHQREVLGEGISQPPGMKKRRRPRTPS